MTTKFSSGKVFLIFLLPFAAVISCSGPSDKRALAEESRITLDYPEAKSDIWSYSDFLFSDGTQEFLVFANSNKKRLDFINIENNKPGYSIPLNGIDSAFDFSFNKFRFFVQSKDSVFILPDETRTVFLINAKGRIVRSWNLRMKTDDLAFTLSGFPNNPIQFSNNRLYIRYLPKIPTFHEKQTYFSISPMITLQMDTGNSIGHAGGWPDEYRTINYYDDYPHFCLVKRENKTQLVYSFASQPELFVYEGEKLVARRPAFSDSIPKATPFPDDSVGNIAFTMRYLVTVPRYGKVLYDPYRKLYYRIALLATDYYSEDKTTTRRPLDRPWSLIVLDENFIKKGEWVFNPGVYIFSPLFVSRKGLLIPHREEKSEDYYRWEFGVFDFSR